MTPPLESAAGLLPCPFCGGEAAYEEVEDRAVSDPAAVRFSVGCGNEECIGFQSMASFPRRADAIAAWNRRAKYDPTLPVPQSLQRMLREPSEHAPPGCHCETRCMAPVVQGRQQPCRDPEKASRFARLSATPEPRDG